MKTTFKDYILYTEGITNKIPDLLRQYPNTSEGFILSLVDYDPTGDIGKFVPWILKMANKKSIILPEDGEKVKETLEEFMIQNKSADFDGAKDINTYKTFGDLAETLEKNKGVKSKSLAKKISEKEGVRKVYEDNTYSIFTITSQEGATKLCRETKWCVKDPKYSAQYLSKGPLFMITKSNEPYVLVHFETKSIKDVFDRPIVRETALELYPLLKNLPEFIKIIPEINKADIASLDEDRIIDIISDLDVLEEYLFNFESPVLLFNIPFKKLFTTSLYGVLKKTITEMLDTHLEMEDTYGDDEDEDAFSILSIGDFVAFSPDMHNYRDVLVDQAIKNIHHQIVTQRGHTIVR